MVTSLKLSGHILFFVFLLPKIKGNPEILGGYPLFFNSSFFFYLGHSFLNLWNSCGGFFGQDLWESISAGSGDSWGLPNPTMGFGTIDELNPAGWRGKKKGGPDACGVSQSTPGFAPIHPKNHVKFLVSGVGRGKKPQIS